MRIWIILLEIDNIGYWSVESWGAIFDSCIRGLGEDPWDVLEDKSKMPNTPQQMLLRGQNL